MFAFLSAIALLQSTAAQTSPAPPQPCASEDHAAFDFWIGEWDVFQTGGETKVGESTISRVSGGCAIDERWRPSSGPDGTSVSLLNHRTGRWEQLWIGGDGHRVDFTGQRVGEAMVMTGYWDDVGGPGVDALIRIHWTPNDDGSVRQSGEASSDHGGTWQPFFDFTYRPSAD